MRERRARHKMGRRLRDGAHLRFAPALEEPWNGTFNLRWWRHVEHEHEMDAHPKEAARANGLGPAV